MLYSYLFPTMFLLAFWALYRHEQVPLVRHLGELLTIAALGGACFGLPTTMVSERERGVWRRYRLAPVSTATLVGSTLVARYVLLVIAGLLQVVLAMGLGMPLPRHPVELVVAFTFVAFAFMGVGLVIAMLADNVPAVQALGQCIFLPMLIIGGVAVPLASLPDWAQRLSSYLPGRYAVDIIQATANGDGLGTAGFHMLALLPDWRCRLSRGREAVSLGSGAAFRDRARQRRGWQSRWPRGLRWGSPPTRAVARVFHLAAGADAGPVCRDSDDASIADRRRSAAVPLPTRPTAAERQAAAPPAARSETPAKPGSLELLGPSNSSNSSVPPAPRRHRPPAPSTLADKQPLAPLAPQTWQAVTLADVERDLVFDRLPPDGGVVTPIAAAGQYPEQDVSDQVAAIGEILLAWLPGNVDDPVQRTRNLLFVLAVVDVAQMPIEPYLPEVVFGEIRQRSPVLRSFSKSCTGSPSIPIRERSRRSPSSARSIFGRSRPTRRNCAIAPPSTA